jgi:anti-sigma B factor antagonist
MAGADEAQDQEAQGEQAQGPQHADRTSGSSDLLHLAVYRGDRASVVAAVGEVDLHTEPLLTSRVNEELGRCPKALVLDLSRVSFLDSSGLAVLVQIRDRAGEHAVPLRLVSDSQAVIRPLVAAGMETMFDILADRDTALDGLP